MEINLIFGYLLKGQIIYIFDGRSLSSYEYTKVYSYKRCLNGTFPWKNCSVKTLVHMLPKWEKRKKYKYSLLSLNTKDLMEHFL